MRVLVCDDDAQVGSVVAKILGLENWDVDLVASGEECLAAMREGPAPDVLVLDHVMPGLLGVEVAELLRSDGFDLPIVLCSAYLGPDLVGDIERLRLHPVSKIDLEGLVRAVRTASSRAEALPLSP